MKTKPTKILLVLIAMVAISSCEIKKEPTIKAPNIIYILADDLGYGDVSALNKESKIRTPHIDQLAAEGMTFTDAHSNSAVCTPTRYGVLTGQYSWRSRIKSGVLLGYSPSLIESTTPTVAKYLQKQGYTTACIGKWHLGIDFKLKDGSYHQGETGVEFTRELIGFKEHTKIDFSTEAKGGAKEAGFDYSFILPASLDFEPYMYLENNLTVEAPTAHTPGNDLDSDPWATGAFWRKGQMAPSFSFEGVLPTFTEKAIQFLQKQQSTDQPFFLYFPMNAPHTPWVPTQQYEGSSNAGQYGDFVQMVDAEVGKLLKALKEYHLEENTLVIFTSDNGAYWRTELIEKFEHRANLNFKGMKADIWEGGHRVPFFVKYPGNVKPGTVSNKAISLTDFFATTQDLLGGQSAKAQDSFSFLSLLKGNEENYQRAPVIHHSSKGKFAIRSKNWKYIEGLGSGGFSEPVSIEIKDGGPEGQLYNMINDPHETTNLYQSEPEVVKEMKELLMEIRGY